MGGRKWWTPSANEGAQLLSLTNRSNCFLFACVALPYRALDSRTPAGYIKVVDHRVPTLRRSWNSETPPSWICSSSYYVDKSQSREPADASQPGRPSRDSLRIRWFPPPLPSSLTERRVGRAGDGVACERAPKGGRRNRRTARSHRDVAGGRVLGAETYVLEEVLQGRLRRQVYIKSRTLRV